MEGKHNIITVYVFLNKVFSWSRYLDNESLLPIGLGAYSESNLFYCNIAKRAPYEV
jgi:hypothetical protein